MAWTYDITAPVVGGKITAAGFGAQTDGAVAELQSAVDAITGGSAGAGATSYASTTTTNTTALLLHEWAKPGNLVQGLTGAVTSVTAGPTTVVAGPGSGRRIVKNLVINATTAGTTVTATLASKTVFAISFTTAGLLTIPACLPVANGENLQFTVNHATSITPAYADRTDTTLDRLGYVNSTGSGTLRASGTAATISQLWLANRDTGAAGEISLTIGSTVIDVTMPASSLLTLDEPIPIPASTAVTYSSVGGTAVTVLAVGY